MAAVETASTERRADLAELLLHGLSRTDAELVEAHSVLQLLRELNEIQILILMMKGSFGQEMFNTDRMAFIERHSAVLTPTAPTFGDIDDSEKIRRWTMHQHYEDQLVRLGLLKDANAAAIAGHVKQLEITDLGRLLLAAIGRPNQGR